MRKILFWALSVIGILVLWLVIVMSIDASRLSGLTLTEQSQTDYKVNLKGNEYTLRYVPKEKLQPLFGRASVEFGHSYALVRNDLPPRVQRSVMHHEIYHLYDFQNKVHKSHKSQEIHAMLASLPYEPLGFLQTVYLTLVSPERRNFYSNLYLSF